MQREVFSRELGLAYGVTNGRLQAKESHLLFQIIVGVLSVIFVFYSDLPLLSVDHPVSRKIQLTTVIGLILIKALVITLSPSP